MVLWRKGRLTQLPGWVHVDITPLVALRGVEYDIQVASWLRVVELARGDVANAVVVVC